MNVRLLPGDDPPGVDESIRLMVESIVDFALFMLDEQGRVVSWNAGAESMKGYNSGQILGQHFSIFYRADEVAQGKPQAELTFAASTGRFEEEGWRLRQDGSKFWARVIITPRRDSAGTLLGFAKLTRDLTAERLAAEDALRRGQIRSQRLVEASPSAMVMINAAGLIELVNRQTEQLFGYSRDELLAQSVEMLVPERFRHNHPKLRAGFFSEPASRPMGAGRDLYGRRKDGTEFPVEIGLNPIETDEGPMVLSAIVDISTRKRLDERFRRVVESAPSAMVMINPAGQIEMVNALAETVFDYPRVELLGQSVEMLVPERFRHHHPTLRASFFADPRSRPMGAGRELYGLRKDGSEFPIEIGLNPIETEDGIMVLSAIVDISDRKQKELRIESALKEKDLLLAEIHHRVKNNLQIIYSLLDIQSARVEDKVALDLLKDSQNRIKSMALIHQTLYQSKDFAHVDFSDFVESLVPNLVQSYGVNSDRIALTTDVIEVQLPIDQAIPCGLIVSELISNALKHAFPGGRRGAIKIGLTTDVAGWIVLSVSDDGVGIPEDFDLAQATTLGLQLVNLLADQLHAEIAIRRSNPTRFVLRFPAER